MQLQNRFQHLKSVFKMARFQGVFQTICLFRPNPFESSFRCAWDWSELFWLFAHLIGHPNAMRTVLFMLLSLAFVENFPPISAFFWAFRITLLFSKIYPDFCSPDQVTGSPCLMTQWDLRTKSSLSLHGVLTAKASTGSPRLTSTTKPNFVLWLRETVAQWILLHYYDFSYHPC